MDERVLESTREGTLEEIQNCRRKIRRLLVIYFVIILLLILSGGGNLFLLLMEGGGKRNVLGKILYAALPLFLWLYTQRPNTSGGILMLYAVVEGIQAAISLVIVSVGSSFFGFDDPASIAMLPLAVLLVFGVVGGQLALFVKLFRSARRLGNLMLAAGPGDRTRADRWDVAMVAVAVVCYMAPAIPAWDSIQSSMTLKRELKQAPEVKIYRVREAIDCMAGTPNSNLLALGTEKRLYVWDTRTRECVWSDDCLAVQYELVPGLMYK